MLQVVFAFATGTAFYILRRVTGSLVWAMLLHALWDFSVFAAGIGKAGDIAALANVLEPIAGFVAVASVVFVIRGAKERIDLPARSPGRTRSRSRQRAAKSDDLVDGNRRRDDGGDPNMWPVPDHLLLSSTRVGDVVRQLTCPTASNVP